MRIQPGMLIISSKDCNRVGRVPLKNLHVNKSDHDPVAVRAETKEECFCLVPSPKRKDRITNAGQPKTKEPKTMRINKNSGVMDHCWA